MTPKKDKPITVLALIMGRQETCADALDKAKKYVDFLAEHIEIESAELFELERGYKQTEEPFLRQYNKAMKIDIALKEASIRHMRRTIDDLTAEFKHFTKAVEEYGKMPADIREQVESIIDIVPSEDLLVH